jgi:hypothetical protein
MRRRLNCRRPKSSSDALVGLLAAGAEVEEGLDLSHHGERAYSPYGSPTTGTGAGLLSPPTSR